MNYPTPGQNKSENSEYAKNLIIRFCEINGLQFPEFSVNDKLPYFGHYVHNSKKIVICLKKAKSPIKTPGFSWSYTGYKADLTAAGIWAHEFGHYVDFYLLNQISKKMKNAIKGESKVSSYEPNAAECFAESMKLFVLNPDLLKQGRPKRYKFLTETCGLRPVITDKWNVVLGNAHEKLISAAANWINK
jgi:hypothetical protein